MKIGSRSGEFKAAYIGGGSMFVPSILNGIFPDDVCVEVPTMVKGKEIVPQKVGELPEWLGGITRLWQFKGG
jgi:alpha-galactosidase/6-phospho-beta-glucosidase family protein